MRNKLAAVARAIDKNIGWSRIGIALSIVIIAIAATTLFRILSRVDTEKVWLALQTTPPRNIALAGILVVASYITLTFYDMFSLRTIGFHNVPYRTAAFAAFASYSIGHNIGATVFTSGAIRYRIYSRWGLTVVDVAKMAFITGLTFWLGNLFVLGVSLAYEPEAAAVINQLPAWLNRTLAIAMLVTIAVYLAWVAWAPRTIGARRWQVTLPSASLTLVQIVIGALDLGCSGLAMYVLLPHNTDLDIIRILVTFVFSTLLGFASSAPGGLGVFDASMLVGLSHFETETLLAALLLFRLIYYIIPFALGLTLLGGRELLFNLRGESRSKRSGDTEAPDCSADSRRVSL